MNKTILVTGAIAGLLAVLLGAFGAHGLEKLVDAKQISSFATGVRYQMYHALLLLLIGSMNFSTVAAKRKMFYFFLGGILLFSGSIYVLVMDEVFSMDFSAIGFITPLGGLLLIIGWIFLLISLLKIK